MIEKDPNLLEEKLLNIYNKIQIEIINHHQLPFKLFETRRTLERQKELLAKGYTKTLNSRHFPNANGLSEAMDLVLYIDGKPTWDTSKIYYYQFLGERIMEEFGDVLTWGGKWQSFKDFPHFELKR